ncbi:hypothetical protein BMS3Bbin02_01132 [bacterium BMS3Bbin02]|nr:hypothetical protein BMS3Bbin02_01132 [bacterium BMS3Bbin02]
MITSEELVDLAENARTDPGAFDQLRAVTEVDGRSVNMEAILGNASPETAVERIDTLTRLDVTGTAQQEPEEFGSPVRPPSAGDGTFLAYLLIAALGVALVVVFIRTRQNRRKMPAPPTAVETAPTLDVQRRTYADDAREAAAQGDYASAVRLWFRWGLAAMEERGRIDDHTVATADTLRQTSHHLHANRVAHDFDIVVYAERPATKTMVDDLEQVWMEILDEENA